MQILSKINSSRWLSSLFALLSGGLLTLAFPPYNFWGLAIGAPALLLLLWLKATPKQAFFLGFLFGLGFFGTGVSWVYISIHEYGHTHAALAAFLTALFIIIFAIFPATQGYILKKLWPNLHWHLLLLGFPASFALLEWVRGWFFSGFPWLFVGHTQVDSPLSGLFPVIGSYGVSFAVTFTAGLVVYVVLAANKKVRLGLITGLIVLWGGSAALAKVAWTTVDSKPISVSLLQGDVSQHMKWDPQEFQRNLEIYYRMTLSQLGQNIIVWPEAAIAAPIGLVKDFVAQLEGLATKYNSTLIVGAPVQVANKEAFYNSVFTYGAGSGIYHKRQLVPFGEYLPFRSLLHGLINFFNIPMSNFISGKSEQPLLNANQIRIAAFICYEIAYSNLVLQALPQAQLLLTVSDDSWFGRSNAQAQHLQIGRVRALETGRYLLFATNNGITAIINTKGKIDKALPPFTTQVLTGTVFAGAGTTPLVSYGNIPIIGLLGLLFIVARISAA